MDCFKVLASEPMFWSRVGMSVNEHQRDEQGRLTFLEPDWSGHLEEHRRFLEAGCRIHTTLLHNGWIDIDTYDYSAVDQTLEAICGLSPEVLYLPRINVNPPQPWYVENPLEVSVTADGPRDAEHIRKLYSEVMTHQDFASLRTCSKAFHGVHLHSFSSEKWVQDATAMLKRLIAYLESGKYSRQIIGYQVAFGMCGETCQWGAWQGPEQWGDFSLVNGKAFYEECLKMYGSPKKIAEAFGMGCVTPENIVPLPQLRLTEDNDLQSYFRVGNERSVRYSQFISRQCADRICHFAKVVKEVAPSKPVGAFYGYLMGKYPNERGHHAIDRLLDSPVVDFLSAPKTYYRSGAGEGGGSQSSSMSIARKKIWLDELDNDTHIAVSYQEKENHPANFEETKTILWREVARNLAWNDQNFWWMDLYGGWFLDDEIMAEIRKLIQFNQTVRTKEHHSISEILLVWDEKSLAYYSGDPTSMGCRTPGVVSEISAELRLCGAPVDECRLMDLKEIDLSPYKMIVFANAFVVDEELRGILAALPDTTLCIWNYAAGVRNPDYDLFNVKALTGIAVDRYEQDQSYSNGYGAVGNCPPIHILPEAEVEILERYPDGAIKTARKGNSLLAASPDLRAKDFHRLAKLQGCHMLTGAGCAVYADNRFVGVFPGKEAVDGLHFPQAGCYRDLISGMEFEKDNDISLNAKSAMVFLQPHE